MNNKKKNLLTGSLIAGAVLASANLFASEENIFSYNDLGSGSEIRTSLATQSISDNAGIYGFELKCGEESKKENKKTESKSTDAKCGEGKCGEGTCGENSEKETEKKKDSEAKAENKSDEAKCGEGKCGN